MFADLTGLPPLLIQVGTHEILLDDALRLARQAALDDVDVTLDRAAAFMVRARPSAARPTERRTAASR